MKNFLTIPIRWVLMAFVLVLVLPQATHAQLPATTEEFCPVGIESEANEEDARKLFEAARQWIEKHQPEALSAQRTQSGTRYVIPTVVYVVGDGATNLHPATYSGTQPKTVSWMMSEFPEAMILDQIDIINNAFDPMGVKFCFAEVDAFGNAIAPPDPGIFPNISASASAASTPGIFYVEEVTYGGMNGMYPPVTAAATAALDPGGALPENDYFKIYIGEMDPTLGGFVANIPAIGSTPGPGDGVFLNYTWTGRNPWCSSGILSCTPGKDLGMTAVHELGHYFGLYHVFQGGCTSGSCTTTGDFICDTPPAGTTAFPTCSYNNACPGTPALYGNYMDYRPDVCYDNFTFDQMAYMEAIFNLTKMDLVDPDHARDVTGCMGQVYYVNLNSTAPTPSGTSWADAFQNLEDALAVAFDNDEIWVALGDYSPPPGQVYDLVDGVGVYGGFDGTETGRTQRDWVTNQTNLNGNGIDDHILTAFNLGAFTSLDGFHIRMGQANGAPPNDAGGGMLIISSDLAVQNCTFEANLAASMGGGVFVRDGAPSFTNCTFIDNFGASEGGAIASDDADLYLLDCRFHANVASDGGAIFHSGFSNSRVINSLFCNNFAGSMASAIYTNSLVFDPMRPTMSVVNSTFTDNTGSYVVYHDSPDELYVVNSISWQNSSGGDFDGMPGSIMTIEYCMLEYPAPWWATVGAGVSVGMDPELTGSCPSITLLPSSPAIDAGLNDPTWSFYFDLYDNVRRCNGVVDIGCHEYPQTGCKNCNESIPKTLAEDDLLIGPNPSEGWFRIRYHSESDYELELYGLDGKKLLHQDITAGNQPMIYLDGIPNGAYIVRVISQNQVFNKKLILRR